MGAAKHLSLSLTLLLCTAGLGSASSTLSTQGLWDDAQPSVPDSIRVPTPGIGTEAGFVELQYVRLSPVLFEHDKATLTAEGQQALNAAVDYIHSNPSIQRLLVDGNTDEVGSSNYNFSLSERRLKSVRAYLSLKGVSQDLIKATGLGETTPIDENWTRSGRSRNRQVAIYAVHASPNNQY